MDTTSEAETICEHPKERRLNHGLVVICKWDVGGGDICGNEIDWWPKVGEECLDCHKKTCKCDYVSPPDREKTVFHTDYGLCEECDPPEEY